MVEHEARGIQQSVEIQNGSDQYTRTVDEMGLELGGEDDVRGDQN